MSVTDRSRPPQRLANSWPRKEGLAGALITTVILGVLPLNPLQAQNSELSKGPLLWFRGGYGAPTTINLELAAQYFIFTVEGRLTSKEVISDEAAGQDAGLLVGLAVPAYSYRYFHASLTMGVVTTWFTPGSPYVDCPQCPEDLGPSLAFGLHIAIRPLAFLGLGAFVYWNRNSALPFSGSGFMLELGKLR